MHDHFNAVKAGLDLGAVGYVINTWIFNYKNDIATYMTIAWLTYCIVEASYSVYKRIKKKHHVD